MELDQVFIFEIGWAFFAAWGIVLAAISVVAFGRDLLPVMRRPAHERERR
jgi:hypothetical protein